jgi:hypothetical protein
MIYDYLKEQLKPLEDRPDEYLKALRKADEEVDRLHQEFGRKWTHCCGCKGYVKRAEAYEALEPSNYSDSIRRVLRCGTCNSVWKVLE